MTTNTGRWWRAYSRARHDPKLLRLSDKHFRWWFNLLCVAADNDGTLPDHADLAVEFRISGKAMTEILDALIAARLFEHNETGISPHNWNARQYKSDVSTTRVKRFRQRHGNVSETPSESDTDTDTEQRVAKATQERASAPAAPEPSHAKSIKLPADWRPTPACRDHATDKGLDPDATAEAFADYFSQGRGRNEKRDDTGWERRWRVWCNADADRRPANGKGVRPAGPGGEAAAFARAAARLGRDEPVQ